MAAIGYTYSGGRLSQLDRKTYRSGTAQHQYYNFAYNVWGQTTATKVGSRTLSTNTYYNYVNDDTARGGNLKSTTYANGDSVSYTYDRFDRLVRKSYNSGSYVAYTYNAEGSPARLSYGDSTGELASYRFEYDSLGRLIRSAELDADGGTVQRTEHIYDGYNRLSRQSWTLGGRTYSESYVYDDPSDTNKNGDGALTQMTTATGAVIDYQYDTLRRLTRSEARQGYRSGHYDRNLTTTSGDVTLHVPRLKGISFETAIIERYRRWESSVEEALIEMYLAGVSVRRVEDITETLWGSKVSPATISELNKKAYVNIEDWRNRPLQGGRYPYVYVDGIYLRRNWGGEYENVAILVAIAVNEDGFREVLGAAECMKEDKASWVNFFQWLRGRGLDGVKLIVGDKCMGMLEAVGEVFPDAKYQRRTVHFYRNVFSVVPKSKVKIVAKMLKAIHAQESKNASREKAQAVIAELKSMKLPEAAKKVKAGIEETLTYCDFPSEHWIKLRTNNVIERLNREIRRRTRVVGAFPDGNSALMLVCARLRHVAGTQWGCKKYMNMKHLEAMEQELLAV